MGRSRFTWQGSVQPACRRRTGSQSRAGLSISRCVSMAPRDRSPTTPTPRRRSGNASVRTPARFTPDHQREAAPGRPVAFGLMLYGFALRPFCFVPGRTFGASQTEPLLRSRAGHRILWRSAAFGKELGRHDVAMDVNNLLENVRRVTRERKAGVWQAPPRGQPSLTRPGPETR